MEQKLNVKQDEQSVMLLIEKQYFSHGLIVGLTYRTINIHAISLTTGLGEPMSLGALVPGCRSHTLNEQIVD